MRYGDNSIGYGAGLIYSMKGTKQMNKHEALLLGCVMAWVASAGAERDELGRVHAIAGLR
jgi:hypothetical protein